MDETDRKRLCDALYIAGPQWGKRSPEDIVNAIQAAGFTVSRAPASPTEAMTDDPEWEAYREYVRVPDCGLTDAELDRLVEASLAERDRRIAIAQTHKRVGWCGCMGPSPHCECTRRNLKQDIAAAIAALRAKPHT